MLENENKSTKSQNKQISAVLVVYMAISTIIIAMLGFQSNSLATRFELLSQVHTTLEASVKQQLQAQSIDAKKDKILAKHPDSPMKAFAEAFDNGADATVLSAVALDPRCGLERLSTPTDKILGPFIPHYLSGDLVSFTPHVGRSKRSL